MANAVNIIHDGGITSYGTQNIACSNGQNYVVNNFAVTRNSVQASQNGATGLPTNVRETQGIDTWTGELQIGTVGQIRPNGGNTFTLTVDASYGAELFIFSFPDYASDNGPGNIRVIPAKGWKSVSGTVTTS